MNTFQELGLSEELLQAIEDMGFETPSAVQAKTIPLLLEKETDVVSLAQTGTGKTAAFGFPMLQKIDAKSRITQGLILSPTRELCLQITQELKNYSKYLKGVNIVAIYEPLGDEIPFEINPDDSIYVPQLKVRSSSFMEALLIGRLVVENGCLQAFQEESNQSFTIVWQADYFLNNNEGSIEMLDREGNVVARVGEMIYLGGGEVRRMDPELLRAPIPEHCSGPQNWLMGEFLPEEYIPNVTGESQ